MDAFRFRRRAKLWAGVAGALCCIVAQAATAQQPVPGHSFTWAGSATLQHQPATLHSDRFTLRSTLIDTVDLHSAGPALQEGPSFALMASLAAQPLTCYNDTIFRDDFDGDGG